MTKLWKLHSPSPKAAQFAHDTGLPLLEAQLLLNRGIANPEATRSFLTPRLADLTDPSLLVDMDPAVNVIADVMERGENITIYGDHDADGLTSTALLLNLFAGIGRPAFFYIPDRLTEGHGLNREAVEKIARERGGLLITVDCGTSGHGEIALASELGLKTVVTDHHQVPGNFRRLCPVVNPHRPDSSFPFKDLAGVGLAFLLAVALRRALRERGWFKKTPEPDLKPYLDLVALGTVADMVPLLDLNRILVSRGIEEMKASRWPGMQAIQEVSAVEPSGVTCRDLAFKIAPRLNASGRMGAPETGIKALTTGETPLARTFAGQLDAMNSHRQTIEREILEKIGETLPNETDLKERRALVISGKGWHRGVLGLVASRLKDKYHRPVLVLCIENGMAIGSGRSIEGFDLYKALTRLEPLLEKYGGHTRAAGLTLKASNIRALDEEMEGLARSTLSEGDLVPVIEADAEVALSELDHESLQSIERLAPFGSGNPPPLFYGRSFEVVASRVVAEKHLKLRVRQGAMTREAIGFNLGNKHPLKGKIVDMMFTPEINHWQGHERIQLKIEDIEETEKNKDVRRVWA